MSLTHSFFFRRTIFSEEWFHPFFYFRTSSSSSLSLYLHAPALDQVPPISFISSEARSRLKIRPTASEHSRVLGQFTRLQNCAISGKRLCVSRTERLRSLRQKYRLKAKARAAPRDPKNKGRGSFSSQPFADKDNQGESDGKLFTRAMCAPKHTRTHAHTRSTRGPPK